MKRKVKLKYEFIEFIPENIPKGILYVSLKFGTVAHLCCCGCGNEVITPLSPTDWRLIFDGETITLDPSIGNWEFACKSHYWIRNNSVVWARLWSENEIKRGKANDILRKKEYHRDKKAKPDSKSIIKKQR